MKFKIFSMLVILGFLAVMPMIYMGKLDPMAMLDAGYKIVAGFNGKVSADISKVVTDEKVQIYKWRDQNGVMQFSNEPPPTTAGVEQIVLNPNSNVIPAVKAPEKKLKEEVKQTATTEKPNPYSVKGMKKVMNDAKNVEQVLQQRHEEQQKMLNDM